MAATRALDGSVAAPRRRRLCEARRTRDGLADDLSFKRDFKTIGPGALDVVDFMISRTGLNADLASRFRAIANIVKNGDKIVTELIETRCQRGGDIARRLRFSERVAEAIQALDEHWDGSGKPLGLAGEEIPVFARIALLAQVVDVFHKKGGRAAALAEIENRAGRWFDPAIAAAFVQAAASEAFWDGLSSSDLPKRIFDLEPAQHKIAVDDGYLDDIAAAFGQVVDAKSPYTSGHSTRVAHYARLVGERLGLDAGRLRWLRRGALLHDVGKLGVSNAILDKPGKLGEEEWKAMRDHAVYSESILSRISAFRDLAGVAAAHHERIDGTGYPKGLKDSEITLETRIILSPISSMRSPPTGPTVRRCRSRRRSKSWAARSARRSTRAASRP